MKISPDSFEELMERLKGQPIFILETELRRFLSKWPQNIKAWYKLIECACAVENNDEAVRISDMFLQHFQSDLQVMRNHIELLLRLGYVDQARLYLEQITATNNSSIDLNLDLIELNFSHDLAYTLSFYLNKLKLNPNSTRIKAGLTSVHSILKNGPPKICFFVGSDWHYSIQESVMQGLDALEIPYYVTTRYWALALFQPSCIIVSDTIPGVMKWIRQRVPRSKIVNTRHGIGVGGKNYGLYSAAATDFICVTSEHLKSDLCRDALLHKDRVWVTGFSQMDGLFKASRMNRSTSAIPKVLFAPTFDPGLGAFEVIGDDPVRWIRGNNQNIFLTIRPHPHLLTRQPALIQYWRSIVQSEPNVAFDDEPSTNLSTLLADTDLLISDVSSVALQFIALNRAIICVVNLEKARLSAKYAPEELEWKMHSATVLIHRKENLRAAVDTALRGGQDAEITFEKQKMRQYLFDGMTDGRAGERIAERLAGLIASRG